MQRLLIISNGSGEDWIGVQLAKAWRAQQPGSEGPDIQALALVGQGAFYQEAGIPLLKAGFSQPSLGFAYLKPQLLWHDFRAGLGQHLRASLAALKSTRGRWNQVLAVGDIVPLLAGVYAQAPLAFVACALSDYYTAGKSCFDPIQVHLMRRHQVQVFARDQLTAENLRARGVKAHSEGNPMLLPLPAPNTQKYSSPKEQILLLPGSHADALVNLRDMLQHLQGLFAQHLQFVLLSAPQLDQLAIADCLQAQGWQPQANTAGYPSWYCQQSQLQVWPASALPDALAQSRLAVGLAGTANEQCVGHGVPVLSFTGQGQQYTAAFAEAQQRLLGSGLCWLGDPHPQLLAWQAERMLREPAYRQAAQQVALERFGQPGACERIVSHLLKLPQTV